MPPSPIILAFDTAAAHCAAVLVQGPKLLAAKVDLMAKGQAEHLFPLIEDMFTASGITWADLAAIAVGTGPGNFTGIRISVAAARGLALSLNIPAIGVSRPEAMAFGTTGPVATLIDARQNRFYLQTFTNGISNDDVRTIDRSALPANTHFLCDDEIDMPADLIATETCLFNATQIAATRLGSDQPRPAPLYVRAPDAALPADPPPTILP